MRSCLNSLKKCIHQKHVARLLLKFKRHLSQEELADQLFISRQAVSKWENGDGTPDLEKLVALATILNVSLDELVLGQVSSSTIEKSSEKTGLTGWDFFARYWWVIIALISIIGFWLTQLFRG